MIESFEGHTEGQTVADVARYTGLSAAAGTSHVQHLLGHAKITMTARYARSLADDKMAAVRRLDLAGFRSQPDPNRTPEPISTEVGEGSKLLPSKAVGL